MRRALSLLACAAVLLGAGCGGGGTDRDVARLREADAALARRPNDPRAMAEVIRAAHGGLEAHTDTTSGEVTPAARPFLDRAAVVWPRYVRATRDRPDGTVAALMSRIYDQGLGRPREAAGAALFVAEARPSADSYIYLATLHARAGDRREAKVAGQKALELADPSDRTRIRQTIRRYVDRTG